MKRTVRNFLRLAAAAGAALFIGVAGLVFGGGGATGTGYMANGPISAFGSIFVNGIEFFTDKASITINGVPNRPESDLRIGMVLTVTGSVDGSGTRGTADAVEYHADALGLVDTAPALGASGGSFGVLGQTILTNAGTVFAGVLDLSQLQVGDYVEVSGFPSPSGLLASRVERKTSVPTVQVQGTIGNVTSTTFTIGSLAVDYSIAALKNVPSNGLAEGMTVVAKGPTPGAGVLQASSVEVIVTTVSGNSNGSVSGVIAEASAAAVTVNGQSIAVTSSTQYVNGGPADLAAGRLVKVDYTVIGASVIASRIEFTQLSDPSFVEANVTAKNAGSVELLGPGGVLVTADGATEFQDDSDAKLEDMTLADINVGDHLQVTGSQVDVDVLLATKVVRRNPASAIAIEGRALSASAPSFTVMDLVIAVTASTDLRDENGNPISADTFFAKAAGRDVSVAATLEGGAIVATSVRLD